jgi:hypothetical protein
MGSFSKCTLFPSFACHPDVRYSRPSPVILSEAKDLALPLRINFAKNLALLWVNIQRESSPSSAHF